MIRFIILSFWSKVKFILKVYINVKTKSEGKEPNRYIVIKPKNGEQ